MKTQIPPIGTHLFGNRSENVRSKIRCKWNFISNSFYPDSITCWNKIGPKLRNSPNLKSFKVSIHSLIRPSPKSIFDIHEPMGIKWLYQLRVGLSSLYEHKCKHNFRDTPSDNCDVCNRIENFDLGIFYFTRCTEARRILLHSLYWGEAYFTSHVVLRRGVFFFTRCTEARRILLHSLYWGAAYFTSHVVLRRGVFYFTRCTEARRILLHSL